MSAPKIPLDERLWEKVDKQTDGCWALEAYRKNGYPTIWLNGKDVYAHRAVYEMMVGPIPVGHHIHHICENRNCVKPQHLEALSPDIHGRMKHNRLKVSLPFYSEREMSECLGLGLA